VRYGHLCALLIPIAVGLHGCDQQAAGTFAVVKTYRDGHPMFMTIDTGLRDGKAKVGHPWFLSISTPIKHPTRDGLTNDAEAAELNDWEDGLEKEFSGECGYVYVGRVTWNGSRELLYYLDKPDSIVPKLEKLATGGSRREFHVESARDDTWGKVDSYLRMIPSR
jgi:Family of unknown function (DUF695)